MNLTQLTLNIRLPSMGAEFRVGHNCEAITLSPYGALIKGPKLEPGAGGYDCGFDVLVTPLGWSRVSAGEVAGEAPELEIRELLGPPPVVVAKHICPRCSRGFLSTQALGSHLVRKHAPGKENKK